MKTFFFHPVTIFLKAIFLLLVSSCVKTKDRFFTEDQFKSDLAKMEIFNNEKLKQLSQYGVTDGSGISMDFYFATDDSLKAQQLAEELESLNYHANRIHPSSNNKNLWVLSASSSRVNMDIQLLNTWTQSVCSLGYKHDCECNGWNPVTE